MMRVKYVIQRTIEATTNIGLRPAQEDRVVVVPRMCNDNVSFCGVFDGRL